jgi:hypothetical protein
LLDWRRHFEPLALDAWQGAKFGVFLDIELPEQSTGH